MSEDVKHDSDLATHEDEVSLLDLAIILAKRKKLVLGIPFVVGICAIAASLMLPFIYTGTAKILPPQQAQSSAMGILGQLSGLSGGLGAFAGSALGLRNPNDLYIAMLSSRPVADNMIQRFDLKKRYKAKLQIEAREALKGASEFTSGKDGIIVIEVNDKDPKVAAAMANAYVDELYKLTQLLAVTEASQRRLFFEKQLEMARTNLRNAEAAARTGLDKGGLVVVDAQGRAMVETTARLRGQISVKEIQISAMRSFATDNNPDLQQATFELEAMKRELAKIEGSANGNNTKGGEVPGGMQNLGLLRDVKYYETIFELLAKQYEIAKLDEARDTSIVQVLEGAVEPERRSKPKRAKIVIIAVLIAGFIALLLAFVFEGLEKRREDPQSRERFDSLRRHLLQWR